jgi:RHS repeat-associated protein
VEQPGLLYITLYNRSNSTNFVYFDDLTVTQAHSRVVVGSDFYPFGLAMDGTEITDEAYRYGYQGQFSEKDLTTGWNEFELRMYDARFGRWLSPDPYGQFASPYVGMGNNPIMSVDPTGGLCCGGMKEAMAEAAKIGAANLQIQLFGKALSDVVVTAPRIILQDGWKTWTTAGIEIARAAYFNNLKDLKFPETSISKVEMVAYQRPGHTLSEWKPGLMDRWAMSESFLGEMSYDIADGLYVTSHFFTPWIEGHLDGRPVVGDEGASAMVNAAAVFLPAGRSQTVKRNFLKKLAASDKTPSWMKQWLSKGKNPPGYVVHHHTPLSIGGLDIAANLRLIEARIHKIIHKFDRRWQRKRKK